MFVHQDWDIVRTKASEKEERLERVCHPVRHFSALLQERRIRSRMTIDDLADRVSVDVNQLALIERGAEMPDASLIARLELVFENVLS